MKATITAWQRSHKIVITYHFFFFFYHQDEIYISFHVIQENDNGYIIIYALKVENRTEKKNYFIGYPVPLSSYILIRFISNKNFN